MKGHYISLPNVFVWSRTLLRVKIINQHTQENIFISLASNVQVISESKFSKTAPRYRGLWFTNQAPGWQPVLFCKSTNSKEGVSDILVGQ